MVPHGLKYLKMKKNRITAVVSENPEESKAQNGAFESNKKEAKVLESEQLWQGNQAPGGGSHANFIQDDS